MAARKAKLPRKGKERTTVSPASKGKQRRLEEQAKIGGGLAGRAAGVIAKRNRALRELLGN